MMKAATLARWEKRLRPYITRLGSRFVVKLYSKRRQAFLKKLIKERPDQYIPPKELEQTLWNIRFRAPLFNAAGMFKNGEGYELVSRQGAGAYLAGTTTWNPREGNTKDGISLPFAPYPNSGAASNWLGLPNIGHAAVAEKLSRIEKVDGCPVGASVMIDPAAESEEGLEHLVKGMFLYEDAGVDFIELNESCPNTEERDETLEALEKRLTFIKYNFLAYRSRRLPVIVKLSTGLPWEYSIKVVDIVYDLNFDGLNFGNTSTRYEVLRKNIDKKERARYDYFTENFGGGVSGKPIRGTSVILTNFATGYLPVKTGQEFHVIRTGGVSTSDDLKKSRFVRAPLSQWFTGYFERFAEHGHDVYKKMYEEYLGVDNN